MLRSFVVIIVCLAITVSTVAQDKPKVAAHNPVGLWLGEIRAQLIAERVVMRIEEVKGRQLSAKWIGIDNENQELPFEKVVFADDKLTLEGRGGQLRYTGRITDKGGIEGAVKRDSQELPVAFRRIEKMPVIKRPQTPQKPYPYLSEDVQFENAAAKIELAGTLTLPKGDGPFPAVVLVSGSGPNDRDQTAFSHKMFLVIADHLARNGIATLRYDDRGVGKSTGQHFGATTQDFAHDAEAAVSFLKGHQKIDPKRIGICGTSEGGAIASLVAVARPKDVAFIILLAAPGVLGEKVTYKQSMLFNDPAEKEIIKDVLDAAIPIMRTAKTTEEAKEKLIAALNKLLAAKESDEKKRRQFEPMIRDQVEKMANPWLRWFVSYDPAPTLKRVTCRVLALNGDKDIQIDADENLPAIAAALKAGGNSNVTTLKMKGLNHSFQTCKTGRLEEYRDTEETIAPQVLTLIRDWILKRK